MEVDEFRRLASNVEVLQEARKWCNRELVYGTDAQECFLLAKFIAIIAETSVDEVFGSADRQSFSEIESKIAKGLAVTRARLRLEGSYLDRIMKWADAHKIPDESPSTGGLFRATGIPRSRERLKHLRFFGVAGFGIRSLPKGFALLKHIQTIDVENNLLNELPWRDLRFMGSLFALRAAKNTISVIGDDVHGLQELRFLDLRQNRVAKVSRLMASLPKLSTLKLGEQAHGYCLNEAGAPVDADTGFAVQHFSKRSSCTVSW
jgi:hypothetical protein